MKQALIITKETLIGFSHRHFKITWNQYTGYTCMYFNRPEFAWKEIGHIVIVKGGIDENGVQGQDDELALFDIEHNSFQHKSCYSAEEACEILLSKYQKSNSCK